jgi:hypothetical protein
MTAASPGAVSPVTLLEGGVSGALDLFIVNGMTHAGKAEIVGLETPRKVDERDGYGITGATTVFNGIKLARWGVLFSIWDAFDFDESRPFFEMLKTPPLTLPPLALGVYHPLLAEEGISAALVLNGGGWSQDDYGLFTRTVKFVQYRQPLPALASPQAAIPTAPVAAVPTNPTQAAAVVVMADNARLRARLSAGQ